MREFKIRENIKNNLDILYKYIFPLLIVGLLINTLFLSNDKKQLNIENQRIIDSLKIENQKYLKLTDSLRDQTEFLNLRKKALLLTGFNIPLSFGKRELEIVFQESKKYSIPPALVLRLIKAESSFRAKAVSSAGASGYMQIMPRTYKVYADILKIEKHDKYANLKVGIYYLNNLYKRFKGYGEDRWRLTLLSYNFGPSRVKNNIDYFLSDKFKNYSYIRKIL